MAKMNGLSIGAPGMITRYITRSVAIFFCDEPRECSLVTCGINYRVLSDPSCRVPRCSVKKYHFLHRRQEAANPIRYELQYNRPAQYCSTIIINSERASEFNARVGPGWLLSAIQTRPNRLSASKLVRSFSRGECVFLRRVGQKVQYHLTRAPAFALFLNTQVRHEAHF